MLFHISAQKFKNSPSAKNMPKGITDKSLPVWKYVTKNFGKNIKEGATLKEQWAIALMIFKNICTKKGIIPFDVNIIEREQLRDKRPDLYNKVKSSSDKAKKYTKKVLDKLVKDKFLKEINKRWVFDKTIYVDGRYHIAAYRRFLLGDKNIPTLLREFSKNKFSHKPDSAFLTFDTNTTVNVEIDKNKNQVFVYITLSFTKNEAENITQNVSGKKLETKLTKMGKGLLNI